MNYHVNLYETCNKNCNILSTLLVQNDAKVDVSIATIHPKKVALLGARVRYMDHNHQYICWNDRLSFVLPRSNRLLALGMVYSYPFVLHVPRNSLFNRRKNYPIGLIQHAISTGNCVFCSNFNNFLDNLINTLQSFK